MRPCKKHWYFRCRTGHVSRGKGFRNTASSGVKAKEMRAEAMHSLTYATQHHFYLSLMHLKIACPLNPKLNEHPGFRIAISPFQHYCLLVFLHNVSLFRGFRCLGIVQLAACSSSTPSSLPVLFPVIAYEYKERLYFDNTDQYSCFVIYRSTIFMASRYQPFSLS